MSKFKIGDVVVHEFLLNNRKLTGVVTKVDVDHLSHDVNEALINVLVLIDNFHEIKGQDDNWGGGDYVGSTVALWDGSVRLKGE